MSKHKPLIPSEIEENIELTQLVQELQEQVAELLEFKNRYEKVVTAGGQSINKMENGEIELLQDVPDSTKMNYDEQVQSVVNTIKILPPNLVDSQGRQLIHNVQALNGRFRVTETHMDDAYNLLPKEAA
jgi:hypothetical protein